MRLVFAGTPPFAAAALAALHAAGHEVAGVLTQPDRPAGRGLKLQASAVKLWAAGQRIEVLQPRSLRLDGRWPDAAAQARSDLQRLAPDLMIVAAYGLILPAWVLALPRHGCLNIHASLLPRWRGAAPIQRAIEAGDRETGITIMQMDEGLDTGDMLLAQSQPIHADDSAASLHDRLAAQGAALIVQALARLQAGTLQRSPQPAAGVTYAHKIDKAEAAIDWDADAEVIERRLRAFDPFPGATATVAGLPTKIWSASVPAGREAASGAAPGRITCCDERELRVACGRGELSLLELQAPGGRRLPVAAFLRTSAARQLRAGHRLDEPAFAS